jgi:hypothetical protein
MKPLNISYSNLKINIFVGIMDFCRTSYSSVIAVVVIVVIIYMAVTITRFANTMRRGLEIPFDSLQNKHYADSIAKDIEQNYPPFLR